MGREESGESYKEVGMGDGAWGGGNIKLTVSFSSTWVTIDLCITKEKKKEKRFNNYLSN